MGRTERTVFISYRRSTGASWALAVSQHLTHHGYDVFFDFTGIPSGDFEHAILGNIRERAHFLILLTPSALARVDRPGDWLRREIEYAMEQRRNIVPLLLEGFDFATPSIGRHLTGTLSALKGYQGLSVPIEYFDAAMERLRTSYLNVAVEAVSHPKVPLPNPLGTAAQRSAAASAPAVTRDDLLAVRWFERGVDVSDIETKIAYYTEAITIVPTFVAPFNNRGNALGRIGDWEGALADYDEAIRLSRNNAEAFNNRGVALAKLGRFERALTDFDESIRLRPDDFESRCNRAISRTDRSDWKGAIADYDEALRLKPDDAETHNNRGVARSKTGDLQGALTDFDAAIKLSPQALEPIYNRALARTDSGDWLGAVADYRAYLELGGEQIATNRPVVEKMIQLLVDRAKAKS